MKEMCRFQNWSKKNEKDTVNEVEYVKVVPLNFEEEVTATQ